MLPYVGFGSFEESQGSHARSLFVAEVFSHSRMLGIAPFTVGYQVAFCGILFEIYQMKALFAGFFGVINDYKKVLIWKIFRMFLEIASSFLNSLGCIGKSSKTANKNACEERKLKFFQEIDRLSPIKSLCQFHGS